MGIIKSEDANSCSATPEGTHRNWNLLLLKKRQYMLENASIIRRYITVITVSPFTFLYKYFLIFQPYRDNQALVVEIETQISFASRYDGKFTAKRFVFTDDIYMSVFIYIQPIVEFKFSRG